MRSRRISIQTRLIPDRIFLALLFTLAQVGFVYAQTSTFTYQGRFTDGGTAANGIYDMQFKLFDGSGNQIGSTITNGAVTVASGVFTVQLDYGATAFPGADRLLEIGVRVAGSGDPYTVLAPRQLLTATPYAIRAGATMTADTATNATQLGGFGANQYVRTSDPRLSDPRTPAPNSSSYIQNTKSQQVANFNISGDGTAGGDLSADSVNAVTQYGLSGDRFIWSAGVGNTFVGYAAGNLDSPGLENSFFGTSVGRTTTGGANSFFGYSAGISNTTGDSNSFFGRTAGYHNNGAANSFFGMQAGEPNTSGSKNAFFGAYSGNANLSGSENTLIGAFADTASGNLSNATAIGYAARVAQSDSLILGGIKGIGLGSDTNVGIGTTAPAFRFTVKTPTSSYGMVHTDGTITMGTYVGGSGNGGYVGTRSNHPLHFFVNDGAASMTVDTGGAVRINTLGVAGAISLCRNPLNQISTCSSSLRYKKDLVPFTRGLALLKQLKPITFKWKEDNSADLGFGAEDIAAIEPLLVTRNDKGEVEGVKYDRITAVLVNAVKEQQQTIEAQQASLKKQKSEIEGLKRFVCRHWHSVACR